MRIKPIKKLKLYGFNNLTKTLSFNFYDICYANKSEIKSDYIAYIDDEYNATRLTNILVDVADIIGANVLNIASQDYDPQGASVTMLVAENHGTEAGACLKNKPVLGPLKDTILGHLDKSHITVHTYPESHPDQGICTFRADIDVSTCGHISPLKALNYLIKSFEPDIAVIDYRVRGFTRDTQGRKLFIDHKINSIQNYIAPKTRERYQLVDMNIYQENIFMTKMIVKEFDLDNYLFSKEKFCLPSNTRKKIKQRIQREMAEIFSGRNINKVKFKAKATQEDGMASAEGLLEVPYND